MPADAVGGVGAAHYALLVLPNRAGGRVDGEAVAGADGRLDARALLAEPTRSATAARRGRLVRAGRVVAAVAGALGARGKPAAAVAAAAVVVALLTRLDDPVAARAAGHAVVVAVAHAALAAHLARRARGQEASAASAPAARTAPHAPDRAGRGAPPLEVGRAVQRAHVLGARVDALAVDALAGAAVARGGRRQHRADLVVALAALRAHHALAAGAAGGRLVTLLAELKVDDAVAAPQLACAGAAAADAATLAEVLRAEPAALDVAARIAAVARGGVAVVAPLAALPHAVATDGRRGGCKAAVGRRKRARAVQERADVGVVVEGLLAVVVHQTAVPKGVLAAEVVRDLVREGVPERLAVAADGDVAPA